MTEQTTPDVTNNERRLARDWAEHIESNTAIWAGTARVRAAARVILNDVPAPTRPTLADMTEEERAACKWMQADTELWGRVVIVLHNAGGGRAVTLNREGHMAYEDHGTITPRPDLPRMEWPDADQGGEEVTKVDYVSVAGGRTAYGPWTVARLRKKPDTAPVLPDGWRLADHKDHGRVIVTNTTPDPSGHVYFVGPADDSMGCDRFFCDPARLTYLDQEEA